MRDALIEKLRRRLMRQGSAGKDRAKHSQYEDDGDDRMAVLFSAVYAVYDERLEKDGAVL